MHLFRFLQLFVAADCTWWGAEQQTLRQGERRVRAKVSGEQSNREGRVFPTRSLFRLLNYKRRRRCQINKKYTSRVNWLKKLSLNSFTLSKV